MSIPQFKVGCFGFIAGCVLLSGGTARAQSRNTQSAQLRIRVVVVPSIRAPLQRNDDRQRTTRESSITFEMTTRHNSAVSSTRDILIVDPETHENRRAQLQTITVVAE